MSQTICQNCKELPARSGSNVCERCVTQQRHLLDNTKPLLTNQHSDDASSVSRCRTCNRDESVAGSRYCARCIAEYNQRKEAVSRNHATSSAATTQQALAATSPTSPPQTVIVMCKDCLVAAAVPGRTLCTHCYTKFQRAQTLEQRNVQHRHEANNNTNNSRNMNNNKIAVNQNRRVSPPTRVPPEYLLPVETAPAALSSSPSSPIPSFPCPSCPLLRQTLSKMKSEQQTQQRNHETILFKKDQEIAALTSQLAAAQQLIHQLHAGPQSHSIPSPAAPDRVTVAAAEMPPRQQQQ